jgi:hypothetical protein
MTSVRFAGTPEPGAPPSGTPGTGAPRPVGRARGIRVDRPVQEDKLPLRRPGAAGAVPCESAASRRASAGTDALFPPRLPGSRGSPFALALPYSVWGIS